MANRLFFAGSGTGWRKKRTRRSQSKKGHLWLKNDRKPNLKRQETRARILPIFGESPFTQNRHLRITTAALSLLVIILAIAVFRLSTIEPPRPIVVRVDEVGRAEAVTYEAAQVQTDPLDPTTKYFLKPLLT